MTARIANVRRATGATSYDSAVQFAIAIEKRLEPVHAECLVARSNPDPATVFSRLALGDKEHISALASVYDNPASPKPAP